MMKVGDSGATRTHDPQLRRLLLYPTELRNRRFFLFAAANIEAVLISPRLGSGLWLGDRIKTTPSRAFCSSTQREFGVRIKPAESFDSQNVFGNACNSVANAEKFFVGLATVLQTPESFSWDLQRCCKHFQKLFGRCSALSKTISMD